MQKRIALLILLLFSFEKAFCVFATVNRWDTKVYGEKDNDRSVIATLIPGTLITTKKLSKEEKIEVFFNETKGWVYKTNLVIYNNIFSDLPSVNQNITNTLDEFYFYFRENINKFSMVDRKVIKKQKIGAVQQIFPSTRNGLFILEGIVTNEGSEVHNLQLYDFESGRSVYIGSFDKRYIKIEGFKFLKNSDYLAILFNISGKRLICIYRTSNGEMVAYSTDATGVFHIEDIFLFYNKKYIWLFQPDKKGLNASFSKERLLTSVSKSWFKGGELIVSADLSSLYIETKSGVLRYDFSKKEFLNTPYLSLVLNEDKTLNYYERDRRGYIKDINKNQTFSLPLNTDFCSFMGNNYIASGRFGRINAYFLYSIDGREIYRYKNIDRIDFLLRDGVIAEVNYENNLCGIIIEYPEKNKFYLLFIEE
ncbi:MAG: hypothetical protein ACP5QT_04990 [Brevinematia bacterium]